MNPCIRLGLIHVFRSSALWSRGPARSVKYVDWVKIAKIKSYRVSLEVGASMMIRAVTSVLM